MQSNLIYTHKFYTFSIFSLNLYWQETEVLTNSACWFLHLWCVQMSFVPQKLLRHISVWLDGLNYVTLTVLLGKELLSLVEEAEKSHRHVKELIESREAQLDNAYESCTKFWRELKRVSRSIKEQTESLESSVKTDPPGVNKHYITQQQAFLQVRFYISIETMLPYKVVLPGS